MSDIKNLKKKWFNKIKHLDFDLILEHVLKKPRFFILAHPEFKITKNQKLKIEKLFNKIIINYPIAYILKQKEFYGLNFIVNKKTLIPRPETEMIIDEIIKTENKKLNSKIFVDVGTGSGCIIITLAKILSTINSKEKNQYIGIDISPPALKIARKNAKIHKVKIKFIHGNLLKPLLKNKKQKIKNLIVIANLPYLTPIQIKNSLTIKHEPQIALDGGIDGLKYYRQLFKQIKTLICNNPNINLTILLEIDSKQSYLICKIIKKFLPKIKLSIKKDLNGKKRLIVIKL